MAGAETEDLSHASLDAESIEALIHAVIPDPRRRLEAEGEIARGGMAVIEAAIDRGLQRRVAMKILRSDHQDSALAVRSFIREAQVTGQLDHPNIVPVHEIAVDDDERLFFTMKLVEGRTLHDLIDALRSTFDRVGERGLKIATAIAHEELLRLLDVYVKVLDAVAFAHSRGVVHCDLKPENVMVGDYGQVYLMDWGIAKILPVPAGGNPLTRRKWVRDTLPLAGSRPEKVIMGTPAYMSPEQARGDQAAIDVRSDVFALGAMLFEVLTGHPPYQGRSAVDVLLKAEDCETALPEHLPIARELRRIVGVAMAREPAARYPRVEDMQADLHRFMRGGDNFPHRSYAPGEWIIREHEVGDAAYIIVSGRCEVLKEIGGKLESLRILGPGEVFGETAILASTPRTASVVTLSEVEAVIVTAEVLEQEVDAMKPWMGAFIRALAQRFSEAQAQRPSSDSPSPAPEPVVRTGRTLRQLQAVKPQQGTLSDPAQVANQAMMLLKSWGRWDRDLGHAMELERLCGAVATICGLGQDEVLAIVRSFEQFNVEPTHDSISLRDDRGLMKELERFLRL